MQLGRIDLNLLVAFDALMAERSVTRAAERMMVGQPAMSATLARLRRLLDDPLLVRQGRQMQPTPLAESLVAPVREALSLIEQTVGGRSAFDPATAHRTFSVVASDYVTVVFLRHALPLLAGEAPGVRLHVRPVSADLEAQLSGNLVDLVIVPREVMGPSSRFSSSGLFDDRFVCAVGGDHPDVGDRITVEQLSTLPYVGYHADPLESVVERQLDAAGITRDVEISIQSFLVVPYLLSGTRRVTLIHERLARAVRRHLDIRILEPPVPLAPITEIMAWSPRQDHDPGHVWLRDRLLDLARSL